MSMRVEATWPSRGSVVGMRFLLAVCLLAAPIALAPPTAAAHSPFATQARLADASRSVFVLTDSVVLGAVEELDQLITAPYRWTGYPGFHLHAAPQVLTQVQAAGYDTVVVAVGNNENTPSATMRRRVRDIMALLADVDQVIWVRPRHWSSQMVRFNTILTEANNRWANLELADWQSVSAGHGEFLYRDGIHLRPAGQDAMAALIMGHYNGAIIQDRATIGRFDSATALPGGVRVGGWAIDLDTNDPVDVRFTIDGKPTEPYPANTSRTDVDAIWNHGPNHGFAYTLPRVRDGIHEICAAGANQAETEWTLLGCHSVTVRSAPIGELEQIRIVRGRIQVKGWAYDPDYNGHVSIRVRGDKQRFVSAIATRERLDVATLTNLGIPDRGFKFTVPIPDSIGEEARFCVWAIDPQQSRNTKLGCLG